MSPRPPLADVSNRTRKRAGNMSDNGEKHLPISKHVCLRLDNLGMENKIGEDLFNQCMTDKVNKLQADGTVLGGRVEGMTAVDDLDVNLGIIDQVDVVSQDTCFSVPLTPIGSDSCNNNSSAGIIFHENTVAALKNNPQLEISGDKNVTHFDQSESSESAKSVKLGKLQSFELERCTSLKGDNEPKPATSAGDMLKTCSCSFCLKAAYMWADLHYQDVKGRISAAKKSKNEALNLFQRIPIDKEADTTDLGKFHSTSKLESELFSQWRSLFLHMEESFTRERNHLQDSFQALKELRENCKLNLEMIDAKPAERD